jgi:hypothetical protein
MEQDCAESKVLFIGKTLETTARKDLIFFRELKGFLNCLKRWPDDLKPCQGLGPCVNISACKEFHLEPPTPESPHLGAGDCHTRFYGCLLPAAGPW